MYYGAGNAKLPHFGVKIHEYGLHFWCPHAEVIQALFPLFRERKLARQSYEEELLLWVVIAHRLLTLRIAQQPERPSSQVMVSIERGCGVFSSRASSGT